MFCAFVLMQKAYFKCAYECFDRTRTHAEISRCAESCSVPITNSQNHFDNEMSVFQVSLFQLEIDDSIVIEI